jgi:F0F1-type ATP synthase assembly protein I
MKSSDDLRAQLARSVAASTAIGLDFACVLLLCILLGIFVDGKLGTGPAGLIVGIVVGIAGGSYSAYVLIRRVLQ